MMQPNRLLPVLSALCALPVLLAGCGSRNKTQTPPAVPGQRTPTTIPVYARVDVYVLNVPAGTVSANAELWTHVTPEPPGEAATLLEHNGIRAGTAAIDQWDQFRALLEKHPATHRRTELLTPFGQAVDLPKRSRRPQQTIFVLDRTGALHGRTFDECENRWTIRIDAMPQRPDSAWITLCPVVRTLRQYYQISRSGDELDMAMHRDERVFDELNLSVELAIGRFLIVTPSQASAWPTSLGHQFLVSEESQSPPSETVLLIVPRRAGAPR
jgi:hypothetical protein